MAGSPPGFVHVIREFLVASQSIRDLIESYRRGKLTFEALDEVFVDDERSPLFRLKEGCHALFRARPESARPPRHREVLFDLAVGSLFHEAMKFRENFYQREVYGPRVRALRDEAGQDAVDLFREFEKILAAVSERLEEGLQETEALLEQTRSQLALLLEEHGEDGLVARCLIENRRLVEDVFGRRLDDLLRGICRSPSRAYEVAGRSYLESGYFAEAERAFVAAEERGGEAAPLHRLLAYARGMRAYLAGDYVASVAELDVWAQSVEPGDAALARLVRVAFSKVDRLVRGEEGARVCAAASAVLERLAGLEARPADQAG